MQLPMQSPAPQTSGMDHNPTPHYQKLHADFQKVSMQQVTNVRRQLGRYILNTATTEMHMLNLVQRITSYDHSSNSNTMHKAHTTQMLCWFHYQISSKDF